MDPSLSADGGFVAFHSVASDLVAGDGNGVHDVFVRDLMAGTTMRASLDLAGRDPNGRSMDPSLSADGRYVAFQSYASDLVAGDGNHAADVFVRDLVGGTTTRASVDAEGGDPNGSSYAPAFSADGRYVAFFSFASDLVPGDGGGHSDVFVRDLVAGVTVRASVDTEGGDPNRWSFFPSVSADGRYVAFHSYASDLVPGDRNAFTDVFVRDLVAGTTVRGSVDTEGGDPNSASTSTSISAEGRYVVFYSYASDLVPGDENNWSDVFVRDLVAGATLRASVDLGGGDPNWNSTYPSISADGRYVAFDSLASDLVARDGNGAQDVFITPNPALAYA